MKFLSCVMLLMLSLTVAGCKWKTIQTTGITGLQVETAGDVRRQFCNEVLDGTLTYSVKADTGVTVNGVRVTLAKLRSFCRNRTTRAPER